MKKFILFLISALTLMSIVVSAHPGSLDDNGGHYNRTTGEYHYHTGEHTESLSSSSYTKNYEKDYEDDEETDTPLFFPLSIGGLYCILILVGLIVAFLVLWLFAEIEYERNRRNPYGGEAHHNFCMPIMALYILAGLWGFVCFGFFLRELPPHNTFFFIVKFVILIFCGICGLRLFCRLCDRLDELYYQHRRR